MAADLSTFSAACAATARLIAAANVRSLVLFDELGAGTDPLEGAALGCALLEDLTRRGCLTLSTTHLAAIAMSASSAPGMDNGAMEYDDAHDRPTFQLRLGRPGRSRGLEIARRIGFRKPIEPPVHGFAILLRVAVIRGADEQADLLLGAEQTRDALDLGVGGDGLEQQKVRPEFRQQPGLGSEPLGDRRG